MEQRFPLEINQFFKCLYPSQLLPRFVISNFSSNFARFLRTDYVDKYKG